MTGQNKKKGGEMDHFQQESGHFFILPDCEMKGRLVILIPLINRNPSLIQKEAGLKNCI